MTVSPLPPQQPAQPSSSSGCLKIGLIGCAVLCVIGVVAVAVLVIFVLGMVKSTDAYKGARDRVIHDPRVVERLGAPVETGWWVKGSVNVKDHQGDANITFPIHGPKGAATVYAVAERQGNRWQYNELRVATDSGPPIDLLR